MGRKCIYCGKLEEAQQVTAANAMTKVLRLSQVTSGYLRTDEGQDVRIDDNKAGLLRELLDGLPEKEPVVVFARFHQDLDRIREAATSIRLRVSELSGRVNELLAWQNGETDVLAVQVQAGSVGVSFVRARYCIFYSLPLSLGDFSQARARVHRPGQKRNVEFIYLLGKDTVDETIYKALLKRREVIEELMDYFKRGGMNL